MKNSVMEMLLKWSRSGMTAYAWGYMLRDNSWGNKGHYHTEEDRELANWERQYLENVITARNAGVSA